MRTAKPGPKGERQDAASQGASAEFLTGAGSTFRDRAFRRSYLSWGALALIVNAWMSVCIISPSAA